MTVGTASAFIAGVVGLTWAWSLVLGAALGLACARLSLIPLYRFTPLPDLAERYRLPQAAFTVPAVSVSFHTGAAITQEAAQGLGGAGGLVIGGLVGGPVGAGIGWILGSLVGSLFGETLAEYKQKIWERLVGVLGEILDDAFGQVEAQLNESWKRLEEQVRANYQRNRALCLRLLAPPKE